MDVPVKANPNPAFAADVELNVALKTAALPVLTSNQGPK